MDVFGLKKKPEESPQVTTPVDEVLRMRQQGFTNNQIVQALQRNGYKTHQIFDAMNQADLKSAGPIQGAVPEGPETQQVPGVQQQVQEQIPGQAQNDIPDLPAGEQQQPPSPEEPEERQQEIQANYEEQIEEVAEAIINEKWEDLMKTINKLLEWREGMENRMAVLMQGLQDLKDSFDGLQKSVIGRVAQYDRTMKSVSTDMKAMDGVFKKILPALTENVNELSRLTNKTKRRTGTARRE